MKLKFLLFVVLGLYPMLSEAQSSLTIFSEDGYKFYLVLNGQRQNSVAMTNVRIDGLSQPYYNTKIIFEDATKPEISKNIPTTDPQTNAFADVTYKIKTTKDGELKMRYFSATPVAPNYTPPPDVYVMHYGQPAPPPQGNTVTQTTVTTTSAPVNGGGANISMGVGGVNMSINVNDPNMNSTVSQTTTTTTYSSSTTTTDGGYNNNSYNNAPPPQRQGCQYPMNPGDFRSAKETVTKASFDETKLSTAKTILSGNCVSTDQVIQLCNLFSFEASKLEFAKFAYGKTTDPGNYFKVGNVFSFDASKTELNEYIAK